ncbi:hypothetical protein Pres01_11900 [Metapseudomonas resinovorans]|uniref:DUF1090 domain-containing protein n=1 Tax=Metapseudomonas resinovorans TaxID=53412 RepID=UPI00098469FF|nr:DUF1090 domain-containing protein [Pseudomonas resinovorans]GLZ85139.1 hypothetical protein Pres01_11900 [Pseudomonas resinovorans]
MKRRLSLPFVLVAGALLTQPLLAAETGCAAKRQAIEQRIEVAKAQGNAAQQAGLEKALAEVKANCTEAGLRQEREAKVAGYEAEVRQREADLREAQAKGDSEKIAKRQAKLEEARAELSAAQKALEN